MLVEIESHRGLNSRSPKLDPTSKAVTFCQVQELGFNITDAGGEILYSMVVLSDLDIKLEMGFSFRKKEPPFL